MSSVTGHPAIATIGPFTAGGVAVLITYVLAAAFVFWLILAFNRLVRLWNLTREGWSGIDVQLRRRHDLIPNLVETVKGYAGFERSVLKEVTDLRARAGEDKPLDQRRTDENALTDRLRSLFALAESYPQLKANESFLDLQHQLSDIENQLQMARRYYNATVRDYNIAVASFPSNLVARMFRFKPAVFFEIELATQRQTPEVHL